MRKSIRKLMKYLKTVEIENERKSEEFGKSRKQVMMVISEGREDSAAMSEIRKQSPICLTFTPEEIINVLQPAIQAMLHRPRLEIAGIAETYASGKRKYSIYVKEEAPDAE
jgi:hypothetical protein